jgi:hypothetical protein
MAISNSGQLQAELAERMHRDDLLNRAAASIALTTKRFSRELRVPEMESIASTTVTGEWTALPIDFQEIRAIYTDQHPLEYYTPYQINALAGTGFRPARPGYTISDMSFRIYPTQTSLPVKLLYYAKIPDLVASSDTNWLLEKYPDAYVEAGMADLCKYVKDYSAAREHEAYVQKFIEDMKRRSRAIQYGAAPLAIRSH